MLVEQQMTLPQKSCYLLASIAKGTQNSLCHLRSFWTSALPAVASGITGQFSNDTSTTWFSPLRFPIPWLVIPLSIPLWNVAVFPKLFTNFQIFYFYQQKLLRVLNGSSESWYILQSAGQVFYNTLMSGD